LTVKKQFSRQLWYAVVFLLLFTALVGVIYPLAVTGFAQVFYKDKANGSLVNLDGKAVGSSLIGQTFSDPKYFWGRLSATAPFAYDAASSSGSNYGPSSPALLAAVRSRIDALTAADPGNTQPIPVDLVTSSASGLDPEISVAAANYQTARVARYRGKSQQVVATLVRKFTKGRQFGILGEPRVNVLQLNLALDALE
jgi:K+-transporting ATPase ATPase C chain